MSYANRKKMYDELKLNHKDVPEVLEKEFGPKVQEKLKKKGKK